MKIESKMPPKVAKIMPSIGYPLIRMKDKNLSMKYVRMGTNIPISNEAKGSMITEAEELRKMPA